MQTSVTVFSLMSLIVMLSACSERRDISEKDLLSYVNEREHGLVQEYSSNGYLIECLYWPRSIVVAREFRNSEIQNDSILKIITNRVKNIQYFMVHFKGRTALEHISALKMYLTIDSRDLLPADEFFAPWKDDGMSRTVLVAFDSPFENAKKISLKIDDGVETIPLNFSKDDILKVNEFVLN